MKSEWWKRKSDMGLTEKRRIRSMQHVLTILLFLLLLLLVRNWIDEAAESKKHEELRRLATYQQIDQE